MHVDKRELRDYTLSQHKCVSAMSSCAAPRCSWIKVNPRIMHTQSECVEHNYKSLTPCPLGSQKEQPVVKGGQDGGGLEGPCHRGTENKP